MTATLFQPVPADSTQDPFSYGAAGKHDVVEVHHLAHDTRNWLTTLRVYCDLLRSSGAVAGSARKWVEELSSAVERGHGLVVSLLDFVENSPESHSSFATAAVSFRPLEPLDLSAAIERRVPLLRRMAGNRIEITVKTVAHAETTALGELAFERILLNLARNAMDAMQQGGKLKITLQHGRPAGRRSLVLSVTDTGSGIPAEFLPRIFDSGFSTKLALAGAPLERGFGLAIVRELTQAAGGSVRVRSSRSSQRHGSTFLVELPRIARSRITMHPSRSSCGPKLEVVPAVPAISNAATVSRMPKTDTRARSNKSGANRKGTRVPC